MIIQLKLKPNCSFDRIEKFSNDKYIIYLKRGLDDPELENYLVQLLSKHFGVVPKKIEISWGKSESERVAEFFS
jgi:uncharacterized protein YggU (UPF0235/DUF167 family)